MGKAGWAGVIILGVFLSSFSWAVNGDMGVGTEPLTDGSQAYPWLIEDLADFDAFAGDSTYWAAGVHTKLMTDIDLSGRTYTRAVIAPDTAIDATFQGIAFSGIFDGCGHVINKCFIDSTATNNSYLGLFGFIRDSGAEIKNLGVKDVVIAGGTSSVNVGGVCGGNSRARIANCYVTGAVSGNSSVGGICGWNYGWIVNCYATSSVSGNTIVGALCGTNNQASYIENCYAIGMVSGEDHIGGLCDSTMGVITNSYFYRFGGPDNGCGMPFNDFQLLDKQSYVGFDFTGTIEDGTNDNWTSVEGHCPKLAWQLDDGPLAPFALDLITTTLDGTGYENDPFIISNYDELMEFRANPSLRIGCYSLTADIDLSGQTYNNAFISERFIGYFDGNYHSINNLNVNGANDVGFFGTFSGEIRNLGLAAVHIEGSDYCGGLSGRNYAGTYINNVDVSGEISGDSYSGGLCGDNQGDIAHCSSSAAVNGMDINIGGLCGSNGNGNITDSYATGLISGARHIGGLCGSNGGDIADCYATGNINGTGYNVGGLCGINGGSITGCYATGGVLGIGDDVGGLCGRNYTGDIINCYATGNIAGEHRYVGGLCGGNSGNITSSYATGTVSGVSSIGGLIGYGYADAYIGCFWDRQISGRTDGVGNQNPDPLGVKGKTTTQMMMLATFTGWDFLDSDGDGADWMMLREGEDYPRLAWQEVYAGDIAGLYGVDLVDFAELAGNWLEAGCPAECEQADIDASGAVDLGDCAVLADDWLRQ